ncbi:hypothetical protein ACU4HD_44800 (plasmid) [Cupriavidus basilensis]
MVKALGLDEAGFLILRRRLGVLAEQWNVREAELQNDLTEQGVNLRQGKQKHDALSAEIASLKARRSNIPAEQVAMRTALCRALDLDEADMPFAGELIRVREDERDWEGAAERLMHNFGLSLLVPDAHYANVSAWVDGTHLRGRLVYFRMRAATRTELPELKRDSLASKLAIKPDSACYDWLERELAHRFDVACCATPEQFRRESRAITRAGQIKAPGERHEKDDRHRLDDRSRYVLGWTNTAKIEALDATARALESELAALGASIGMIQAEQGTLKAKLQAMSKLDVFADFQEIDWQPLAMEVARLAEERRKLESASDVLKQLTARLNEILQALKDTEAELEFYRDKRSKTEQKVSDAETLREQTCAKLDEPCMEAHAAHFAQIEAMRPEALGEHMLTIEACDNRESDMRNWLQSQIDAENKNSSACAIGSSTPCAPIARPSHWIRRR